MKATKVLSSTLVIITFIGTIIIFLLFLKQKQINSLERIKIYRFEKTLFNTNQEKIEGDILQWEKELGTFFENFNHEVLRTNSNNKNYKEEVLTFISHSDMREAYDTLLEKYQNIEFLEVELANSFNIYKKHFPDKKMPKVVTYFSGFNFGVATNDTFLVIGLDYFLGKDCNFYKRLNIPEYMIQQSQKRFIVPYCMEAIANNEFGVFDRETDFLSQIIFKGKLMTFIDAMLPNYSASDKLRYSEKDFLWCKENEKNIWKFFIDRELLFSNDYKQFTSYLNFSPFAKGMPKQSPGRIAYWLGWNIVQDYIKNNPNITLDELIQNTNAQEILRESGYKP